MSLRAIGLRAGYGSLATPAQPSTPPVRSGPRRRGRVEPRTRERGEEVTFTLPLDHASSTRLDDQVLSADDL